MLRTNRDSVSGDIIESLDAATKYSNVLYFASSHVARSFPFDGLLRGPFPKPRRLFNVLTNVCRRDIRHPLLSDSNAQCSAFRCRAK